MESKKFYWLKLKRDFFKRHDIFLIEGLERGTDISLFYIKLMLESVDHEGRLRFDDEMPYTPEMLSSLTRMSLDTVNRSMEVLKSFNLLKIEEDGTIVLPKVTAMIDSASDTDGAKRARRYRERKKTECDELSQQALQNVTPTVTNRHEIQSKSKSKCKSKSKSYISIHPTLDDVTAYCVERNSPVDPIKFFEYYDAGNWKDSKGNPVKNWKQKLITWERKESPKSSGNEFLDLLGEMEDGND